ncbi:MAG: TetR/AcrR family transcriptional regulator [Candidatus Heimdallarchaeota archaeon]
MSEEPSKLKKDQRKESILSSAIKVMSEKGFDATTMREIAKTEAISETLLYRFFKNKHEVLFGIMQSKMLETIKSFEEFVETTKVLIPDPKTSLPLIFKLMKNKFKENKELIVLLTKEQDKLREHFSEIRKNSAHKGISQFGKQIMDKMRSLQIEEALTEYFVRCKQAGNLKEELNTKSVTKIFLNLIFSPFPLLPMMNPMKQFPDEAMIDDLLETQIQIFLYGILPDK